MVTTQLEQEAKNFIGKKGPNYVLNFATKEEKEYFEGTIYQNGVATIGIITSPNFYSSLHKATK